MSRHQVSVTSLLGHSRQEPDPRGWFGQMKSRPEMGNRGSDEEEGEPRSLARGAMPKDGITGNLALGKGNLHLSLHSTA